MMEIKPIQLKDIPSCLTILRSLPQWFGIEASIVKYGETLKALNGYVALNADEVAGFVGLKYFGHQSIEVDVIGVKPGLRGEGIGTRLLEAVESNATPATLFLHTKTLAASHPNPDYAETRAFWLARGFLPMDAHMLWGPDNPCLVLVKLLGARAS